MDIIIRQATIDDIKDLAAIEAACFPAAEAASYKDIYERFQTFPQWFLVAEIDHQIVGFINGCTTNQPILEDELYHDPSLHKPSGAYQTVFGLDVLEAYRCQGIASLLMKSFIQLAIDHHKKAVILTCKDHLIDYYEKFGFVHQGISSSSHGGAQWNDMILSL